MSHSVASPVIIPGSGSKKEKDSGEFVAYIGMIILGAATLLPFF